MNIDKYLIEIKALLQENVFMIDDETSFRGKSPVLKNPSLSEYISFKNNTKYNAIRGIGINNDIYIVDANSGIHDVLASKILMYLGYDLDKIYIDDYVNGIFKEDEYDNFSCQKCNRNKRLEKLCNLRNTQGNNKENYFDLETEYNDYEIDSIDKDNFLSFENWLKNRINDSER